MLKKTVPFLLCGSFLLAIDAHADNTLGQELSFEQALIELNHFSPALAAANAQYLSKEAQAKAMQSLDLPELSVSAEGFSMEKTLGVQHTRINELIINGANASLPSGSALSLDKLVISQQGIRSALTASWLLYSGGKITALQKGAQAQAKQAEHSAQLSKETLTLTLIQLYFGQQLAQQVLALRKNLLLGLKEHLDNALKLEKNGMLAKAQRLQAQVAYDSAKRAREAASYDLEKMQIALQHMLGLSQYVKTTTPIFISTRFFGQKDDFIDSSIANNPRLAAISSLEEAAREKIKVERADWHPSVYLFGQYNLNRPGELLTDLDWIVGVGMKWTINSTLDRNYKEQAAAHEATAAKYALIDARLQITTQVSQAYDGLTSAKRQYELSESALVSATENLRVQEISFREGTGTSTDVSDARVNLNNVHVDRVAAAYQYDLQLAQLLYASGQINDFIQYSSKDNQLLAQ